MSRKYTTEERKQLAREAFNGVREALYEHCRQVHGYLFDGATWPANGLSEGGVIRAVQAMSGDDLEACLAVG